MAKYYRSRNGSVYRYIKPAKVFNTDSEVAILQKMSDHAGFFIADSLDSFSSISEQTALEKAPLWLHPKYHFPDIEYTKDKLLLRDDGGFSRSVKAMKHLLINKGIVDGAIFNGINNDDELEARIIERIKDYQKTEELEEIFHLIQTWGGSSGRGIYVFDMGMPWTEVWQKIEPKYTELALLCLGTNNTSDSSVMAMVKGVKSFNNSIAHLGVSFITKHVRYWLSKPMKDDALPIYDSVMAMEIMRKNTASINDLAAYWKGMISMSQHLEIGLVPLERQLFKNAIKSR